MPDFAARITTLVDTNAPPIDVEELVRQLESGGEMAGTPPVRRHRRAANWAVAVGAAIVVFVVVGGFVWLIGGNGSDVIDEPTSTTAAPPSTTSPATTTTAAPPVGSFGTFGWERHDVGELITHAAPWRDGYVALRSDRVASSADGITWEEWPEQPFDEPTDRYGTQLALTIDDGDVVVVVAEPGVRLRAFASQGDEPWRNLTFEPGEIAYEGRALEVIVNPDDGVYVRLKAT